MSLDNLDFASQKPTIGDATQQSEKIRKKMVPYCLATANDLLSSSLTLFF